MGNRPRLLTDPEELAASAEFKRLLQLCGKRQEQVASEIGEGVSQGTVWQWANNRLAIPANRAADAARAVGGDAEAISVAYRLAKELYAPARIEEDHEHTENYSRAASRSHRTGLPLATLADAMLLVRLYVQDHELPQEVLQDPLLLKTAFDLVAESGDGVSLVNVIELKKKLAGRLPKGIHAGSGEEAKKAG